jgi:outer membrane protein assembly factor BamE (lipoprotein component of BamABCDE complex)
MSKCMALGVAVLVATSGCAILGRQQKDHRLDAESVAKVQKGMTKAEVTTLLGAPQEIIFSNKEHDPLREHAYVFEHTTTLYTAIVLAFINFGNSDEKRDRVMVFFDDQGRVDHVGASLRAEQAAYGFPFGR